MKTQTASAQVNSFDDTTFQLDPLKPFALLRKELMAQGVNDLEAITDQLYKLHQLKLEAKNFQYNDLCFADGSDTEVDIVDPDGSKAHCVVWCVNHYLGLNRHPTVIEKTKQAV